MAEEHIAPTARLKSTTLNKYLKQAVEPIFRKSFLLGALKAYKRLRYNEGGLKLEWRPRFRRDTITAGRGTATTITFPIMNVHKTATLPWRNYWMGCSIHEFEKLANKGESAWFNIVQGIVDQKIDDFMDDLRFKMYLDGNAAASNRDLHGLESWHSDDGTTVGTTGYVGNPNDTYAGQSTALGVSGTWSAPSGFGWPLGATGEVEYCWWSPLNVDYGASFGGTANSWKLQWQQAINFGVSYLEKLQGVRPDVCLLDSELLRQAQDSLISVQTFELTQRSKLTDAGFQTLAHNGVEFHSEMGVTADCGYLIPFSKLHLHSMQPQLVMTEKDHDITTLTDLIALKAWIQLRAESPAFFGKLRRITALGT